VREHSTWLGREAVAIDNSDGRGDFVLVCDHASNWVPRGLKGLGLSPGELDRHIAWDPGALQVAQRLAAALDSPLVHATVSRLVLDVNRAPAHPGSVVTVSEDTVIPGNHELSSEERAQRVRDIYEPYHSALANVIATRTARGIVPRIVSIHSFTPVYRKVSRPWHLGVLSDGDRRMADPLLELLRAGGDLNVGDNQPYAPTDGVYHTLSRHCAAQNLQSVLLELRADLIEAAETQNQWAGKLRQALEAIH
jgi:predicted N-formylglutamate amidohydrolase